MLLEMVGLRLGAIAFGPSSLPAPRSSQPLGPTCASWSSTECMHRIIRKAGLEPWPKTFQNVRMTRETELAEPFPFHVVRTWIGDSRPVATKHSLRLTDEHFERAINGATAHPTNVAQNVAQKPRPTTRKTSATRAGRAQGALTLQLQMIASDFRPLRTASPTGKCPVQDSNLRPAD